MVPKGLIRVGPDGDRPGAIPCRNPLDGALNHDRGPVAPVGLPPFEGPLVHVYLMCGEPLMTPFPGPVVGLRPKPHHGPGVGRVRATIIGQGTVSDRAGATAIALNAQNADPTPILHRTRRGAVAYEGMAEIGGTRGTRTLEIPEDLAERHC